MSARIRVAGTILSDFICPWCYIAERRLNQAASELGIELSLQFLPFELNPQMPTDGITRHQYRSGKFGSWERSLQLDQETLQASKDDPVEINYALIERTPNTRRAHQLVQLAATHSLSKQRSVASAIFIAYFRDGLDIGCLDTLSGIAHSCGLDVAHALKYLREGLGVSKVLEVQENARSRGLSGVPFFYFGKGLHMGGAQPKSVMTDILRAAAATTTDSD